VIARETTMYAKTLLPLLAFLLCGFADAAHAAASRLAPGVLVDADAGRAFVTDPAGFAQAISLADGRSAWISREPAVPLLESGGRLFALGRIEARGVGLLLLLDPATGEVLDRVAFDVPEHVAASLVPRPKVRFGIANASSAGSTTRPRWPPRRWPIPYSARAGSGRCGRAARATRWRDRPCRMRGCRSRCSARPCSTAPNRSQAVPTVASLATARGSSPGTSRAGPNAGTWTCSIRCTAGRCRPEAARARCARRAQCLGDLRHIAPVPRGPKIDSAGGCRGKETAMTAMLVTTLVIGGLLLFGVFAILGLVFKVIGGVFELFFGLLGLVLGAIGTVFGLLVGGLATLFAGGIVLLVLGALALPLLLPVLLVAGLVWLIVRAASPRPVAIVPPTPPAAPALAPGA